MTKSMTKKSPKKDKKAPDKTADKMQAREVALALIRKEYGDGSIMKMSDSPTNFSGISTGSLSLDLALGGRGLPRGRVVEIYGPEGSGKTTLALSVLAECQAEGGSAAFIDAEHALDPVYAKAIGVDTDELLLSQPDSGEQGLGIAETLITANAVDIVVIDSVAALVPQAELDGNIGDTHIGLQARLMSQALRKLTHVVSNSNVILLFINQLREKIGVTFGSPEVTPGGRALKFYASVRLDVRRIGQIKDADGTVLGGRIRIKAVKNKVAPPFRQAEVDLIFGKGLCKYGDLVDLAVEEGFIQKAGSWFSMGETKIGQGRDSAKAFVQEHAEVAAELRAKIIEKRTTIVK